jgi:hypothetical protein
MKTKERKKHVGSTPRRREIHQNQLQGHKQLYNNHFSENCTYPDYLFCCRFRMRRSLFLRIVEDIEKAEQYFLQKT